MRSACITARLLGRRSASEPSQGDLAERQKDGTLPIGRQRLPEGLSRLSGIAHGGIPASGPAREAPRVRAWASRPALSNDQRCRVWGIENTLHWVLDVTFREDDSRVRDRRAARNLAILRKIALNLVGRDRSTKASVRARRKKAAWNDDYMLQLLAG